MKVSSYFPLAFKYYENSYKTLGFYWS